MLITLLSGCGVGTSEYDAVYYWGAEVNAVCPCGTEECFWVRSETETLAELRNFVEVNTTEPYTGVHVRFAGHRLEAASDGFAADYDGQIHIDRILSLDVDLPEKCLKR